MIVRPERPHPGAQLAQTSPDLMRDLLTTFVEALLSAQADAVCGAGYGERTPQRVNSRNG